ncbi:hypothetical protein PINS_up008466 [Pythium insidiosum]|nr:hypothetical protein PINS_up008466 [Pythium insidiosum]
MILVERPPRQLPAVSSGRSLCIIPSSSEYFQATTQALVMCLEFCCGFLCAKALENNNNSNFHHQQQRRQSRPRTTYVQPVAVTAPVTNDPSRHIVYMERSPNGSLHPISPSQIPPETRAKASEQLPVAQPWTSPKHL